MNSSSKRRAAFLSLLYRLQNVVQSAKWHPEGNALYHSMQVFDRACDQRPEDKEFLLAALLHDVGKAIDPSDHVNAGLQALNGYINGRTRWLIAHHMETHAIADQTIPEHQHRMLKKHPDYEMLLVLGWCDRGGRQCGIEVSTPEAALAQIDQLEQTSSFASQRNY